MKIKLFLLSFILLIIGGQVNAQGTTNIGGSSSFDYLSPKKYTIASTKILGVPQYDHDAIRVISGLTPGKEITVPGDDITKAIKSLWAQELFSNVEVSADKIIGDEIFLNIKLTGRPKLNYYKIVGLNSSDSTTYGLRNGEKDKIREAINLFKGKTITEALPSNTESQVRAFYQEKGYLNCTVKIDQEQDTNGFNQVNFIIKVDKGERIKIKSINIYGNEDVDLTHYDSKIKRFFGH